MGAAYTVAFARAVKGEHVKAFWLGLRDNDVAERYRRHREVASCGYSSFSQVARRLLGSHRRSSYLYGPLKQAYRQNRSGSLRRRYHSASVHQVIVIAPLMSAMGRKQTLSTEERQGSIRRVGQLSPRRQTVPVGVPPIGRLIEHNYVAVSGGNGVGRWRCDPPPNTSGAVIIADKKRPWRLVDHKWNLHCGPHVRNGSEADIP
jgi:hypothetical protein